MLYLIGSFLVLFVVLSVIIIIFEKLKIGVCLCKRRLNGKTAIITGGTAGMGLEIAKDFAMRGARVIVACPFQEEGLNAKNEIIQETENDNIVFKFLDLGSLESTRQFAADILKTEDRLDILVNNAGITAKPTLTKDELNIVMQVNYFGTFLLTILLLPLLKKSGKPGDPSRIVNTTSRMYLLGKVVVGDLNKFNSQIRMYSDSKLCLILFTHELNKRLRGWDVVVNSVHPGTTGTAIFNNFNNIIGPILTYLAGVLFKKTWQGAQTAIHAAVNKKAGEISGVYFANCKIRKLQSKARDDKLAKELWLESVRLVKLSEEEIEKCFGL